MCIKEYIKNGLLYLDGGMGTLLQKEGLCAGELPERRNLSHPESITAIHRAYFDAGSNVVSTNTFGANSLKFSSEELDAVVRAAVENARRAQRESIGTQPKWVALDIGPTGRMLKPYGDLDFEDAVAIFAETVRLGVKYGVDLIFIETMNDTYETKAALLAAKENSSLPVFVSNAYGEDGKLLTGADAMAVIALLEGMGADAVGVNCSFGPKALSGIVKNYLKYASVPVFFKPNAGLPRAENGQTVYDVSPEDFATEIEALVRLGVHGVGGCCGTTPAYIAETVRKTAGILPPPVTKKDISLVSSYTHAVVLGERPVLIGERINPTGKPRFKEALRAHDVDYVVKEGLKEEEAGVHILDVNVGLPEIDELQSVCDLPLQIDTASSEAMEAALRRYNGKALINSVNGKEESLRAVLPLVKKYGGVVVALTLDEHGIPDTAEARVEIAARILKEAEKYGIDKKDVIVDPLAMAVSADQNAAKQTLLAVKLLKESLGVNTSLGVSNVSFGLPARDTVNATFFALALGNGLSAAIMNPHSLDMMKAYYTYLTLGGYDESCQGYIAFAERLPTAESGALRSTQAFAFEAGAGTLKEAVIKGLKGEAAASARALLKTKDALSVIKEDIVPALDTVGDGFEKKTVYLPQLLMSAEAAASAFEVIKASMPSDGKADKCAVVLATVKGDIHDIGKNIVKMLLENYGFRVFDLGRDVSPERVLQAVLERDAALVGLSALMTTTVPAMEETVRLLKKEAPHCRVMVGGAVLTPEYAKAIGADAYGKDAMEAVRYAQAVDAEQK